MLIWLQCLEIDWKHWQGQEQVNTAYELTTNTGFVLHLKEMDSLMSKLRTTTKYKDDDKLPPIHPGQILKTEFMEPLNLSATQLALHMGIPLSRVIMIVNCKRNLTADTAFRLARVFKTTPEFWLNLQSQYEVAMLDYTGATKKICLEVREFSGTPKLS